MPLKFLLYTFFNKVGHYISCAQISHFEHAAVLWRRAMWPVSESFIQHVCCPDGPFRFFVVSRRQCPVASDHCACGCPRHHHDIDPPTTVDMPDWKPSRCGKGTGQWRILDPVKGCIPQHCKVDWVRVRFVKKAVGGSFPSLFPSPFSPSLPFLFPSPRSLPFPSLPLEVGPLKFS